MMRITRLCLFLALFLVIFPLPVQAKETTAVTFPLQAAFVRDGQLWLKVGNQETQLTQNGTVSLPLWSHDGRFLSYFKDKTLWVYDRTKSKHFQITLPERDGEIRNPSWASNKNILAFQTNGSKLTVADLQCGKPPATLKHLSSGIYQFSWLPDGSGFLASTIATPINNGWTKPALYIIPLSAIGEGNSKGLRFYTLPGTVTKGNIETLAISTSAFKWSKDSKWVAFIVQPTASLSADSNMLCVLSMDGKRFEPLDEILPNENWFAWAPYRNALGYIAGNGRFALFNKDLKIQELPAWKSTTLTPNLFVDTAFTWLSDQQLTVSRAPESEEMTAPEQLNKPMLYQVNLQDQTQTPISTPPVGFGDYNPNYVKRSQKLAWVRSNNQQSSIWVANPDGTQATEWISGLGAGSNYYEQRSWREVLSIYGARK